MANALEGIKPRTRPISTYTTYTSPSDTNTVKMVNNWERSDTALPIAELIKLIGRIDHTDMLARVEKQVDNRKNQYHPEQIMLLNATLYGRRRYINVES